MNVIDVLAYGHRDIERVLDRMRPGDWDATALGVWTTKDLVGHLGAFEVRFADVLASFVGEPATSNLMQADPATFNDDQAAIRRDWTVAAILGEFRQANERVTTLARRVDRAVWSEVGTIPWYGAEYALDDLAIYSIYG